MPSGMQAQSMGTKLSRILESATEETLAEIDAEIATAEARVKSLKVAREIVAEEVLNRVSKPATKRASANGCATPVTTETLIGKNDEAVHVPSGNGMDATEKIALFLLYNGPKRSDTIKRQLGISDEEFDRACADQQLFCKSGTVWTLTTYGHQKFKKEDQRC